MLADRNQNQAIQYGDGPVLVNAGPGSGKTFVITHRISYLIESGKAAPEEILVITFTQSAAQQMKERYLSLAGESHTLVTFGTFHAFFYQVIRQQLKFRQTKIIQLDEKKKVLKEALTDLSLPSFDDAHLEEILSEISCVKTFMQQPEDYQSSSVNPRNFIHIYFQYMHLLQKYHYIDFEDMILNCLKITKKDSTISDTYKERFRYVLVDEFQDINPMQYEVLLHLFGRTHNVFVVGDDDQAIYGFRGSSPKMMFRFISEYQDASQINLSCNYRSREIIVRTAQKVIEQNKERFSKQISTVREAGDLTCLAFESKEAELQKIREELTKYKYMGKLSNCAVLFRTNAEAVLFCEFLINSKIPYIRNEKANSIHDHFIIKDIQAYMEFANGNYNRRHFYRIMNRPLRYLKRDLVSKENIDWEELQNGIMCNQEQRKRLSSLAYDLNVLKSLTPYAALVYLQKKIGYEDFLLKEAMRRGIKYRLYEEIYETVKLISKDYATWNDFKLYLQGETTIVKDENETVDNRITIMSIHGAKGLEWEHVYIPGCNEGKIPHPKMRDKSEIEEERRLFYVAMTRAKETLHISYVDDHKRYKASPFLEVINEQHKNNPQEGVNL